jgi:hypothetical protein
VSQESRHRLWQAWLLRLAVAAGLLSLIGYFSHPSISPLMCKVYG